MIIILENDISIPNKNLNYLVNIFKKYSIYHANDENFCRLFAQKINLNDLYMNEFLEGLSDVLDFRLEYIPQGYGCGLKFSLVSNYNGNE